MTTITTGTFINYYDGTDLFVLISNGNGSTVEKINDEDMYKARAICDKYMKKEFLEKEDILNMQDELRDVFEYYVHIYIVENVARNGDNPVFCRCNHEYFS